MGRLAYVGAGVDVLERVAIAAKEPLVVWRDDELYGRTFTHGVEFRKRIEQRVERVVGEYVECTQ